MVLQASSEYNRVGRDDVDEGRVRDAIIGEELKLGCKVFNRVGQEERRELGNDGGDVSWGETEAFEKFDD